MSVATQVNSKSFQRYQNASLWAVTAFFSGEKPSVRLRNFAQFRAALLRQNVPLACIELRAPGSKFLLREGDAELLLQLHGETDLWQKECLLNTAIRALPPSCDKVCWLDSDVLFLDDTWAQRTSEVLTQKQIVQAYETVFRAPPEVEAQQVFARDFDWDSVPFAYQNPQGCLLHSALYLQSTEQKGPWTPGYAWAARRSLLESLGLFEYCIIGGADQIICDGVLGTRLREHGYYSLPQFHSLLQEHQQSLYEAVGGAAGYVPGRIVHLHHGSWSSRRYTDRVGILAEHDFSPERDIVKQNGIWQWANASKELQHAVREYFRGRS